MLNDTAHLAGGRAGGISLLGFAWKIAGSFALGLEATLLSRKSRPLQTVCDSPWQKHRFYIKGAGSVQEEDEAPRHQSCHLALRTKQVKRGEWNKCDAGPRTCFPPDRTAVAAELLWPLKLHPIHWQIISSASQQQDMVFLLLFPPL